MLLYAALVSTVVLVVVAAWQHKLGQAFSCSPKQYLRSAALGFLNPNPPIDGARTAEGGKGVTSAMMGA